MLSKPYENSSEQITVEAPEMFECKHMLLDK